MNTATAPIAAGTPAPTETTPVDSTAPANQPTTAAQLQDVKLPQLLEQKPSFKTLQELGLAKLTELAKENVKAQTSVKTNADRFKATASGVGKILAAMKIAYADAQDNRVLARGTSFEDYHKSVTGEKPWNHAMQCARVFLELVLTEKLTEEDYDLCSADWHQTASVILGELKKAGFDLNSEEVGEVIDILKKRPSDGAKLLRKIKARIKGTETAEPGDPEVLSVSDLRNADALVRRVCQSDYEAAGHKTAGIVLVATILAEHAKSEKREDAAEAVYNRLIDALENCGSPEQQNEWHKKRAVLLAKQAPPAPAAEQAPEEKAA